MDNENSAQRLRLDMRGLNRIFIGNLFVFLDFKFNGFDIIPDFIGYLIIISGLTLLSQYHSKYADAKKFALFLFLRINIYNFFKNSFRAHF